MTALDLEPDGEKPLTATEATAFDDAEQVIEKGVKTFIEVGKALQLIRDGRLYRETHSSFEEYCQERWKISRQQAYRQIDAAAVVEAVSPNGDTPTPRTESAARELAPLKGDPEQAREAWQETVEQHGPEPTAKQVKQVVERRKRPAPAEPAVPVPAAQEDEEHVIFTCSELSSALARKYHESPRKVDKIAEVLGLIFEIRVRVGFSPLRDTQVQRMLEIDFDPEQVVSELREVADVFESLIARIEARSQNDHEPAASEPVGKVANTDGQREE